ncbi:hypothetical protein ACFFWC_26945 [Plantactinospora siamensis]|uniref:Uncharacterized protein n=1 Tax=Plantactinospora siamensis TaxID=555372 RepID=A0ABV6NZX6_9ACTN
MDPEIEPLVRDAIHAAVIRDFDVLDERLQALPAGEPTARAVELTTALVYLIMIDIHNGKPTEEEIRGVAAEIARGEAWAAPTAEEVTSYLVRLLNGQPFGTEVPSENVVILAFVCAANLLSSCHRDDEEWWDYLDRAEAALEAA